MSWATDLRESYEDDLIGGEPVEPEPVKQKTSPMAFLEGIPTWMRDAACKGTDPAMFFPEKGDKDRVAAYARQVCAKCPVRTPCAEYAIEHLRTAERDVGIWGGLNSKDRQAIRRQRRRVG